MRDDKIVEIGELEQLRAAHPEEQVNDFGLAALMPGFVDVHTHLEYTAMRGLVDDLPYSRWKLQLMQREEAFEAVTGRDSALLGALEALQSGITTIADITSTGAAGHAAKAAGLRGRIFREVATMEKPRYPEVMARAAADIEQWRSSDPAACLQIGIAPHSPYSVHPNLFRAVADFAADGTPVAMHLAGSREEYQFVKYGSSMMATDIREEYDQRAPLWLPTGVSPVRYVLQWGLFDVPDVMVVHLTQVDDYDIEVLASAMSRLRTVRAATQSLRWAPLRCRSSCVPGCGWASVPDSPAASNPWTCSRRCVSACSYSALSSARRSGCRPDRS